MHILNDEDDFQVFLNHPTIILQKDTFKILERMSITKYFGDNIKRCAIETSNTNPSLV